MGNAFRVAQGLIQRVCVTACVDDDQCVPLGQHALCHLVIRQPTCVADRHAAQTAIKTRGCGRNLAYVTQTANKGSFGVVRAFDQRRLGRCAKDNRGPVVAR